MQFTTVQVIFICRFSQLPRFPSSSPSSASSFIILGLTSCLPPRRPAPHQVVVVLTVDSCCVLFVLEKGELHNNANSFSRYFFLPDYIAGRRVPISFVQDISVFRVFFSVVCISSEENHSYSLTSLSLVLFSLFHRSRPVGSCVALTVSGEGGHQFSLRCRVVAGLLSIVSWKYPPRVFVFSAGKTLMGRELLLLLAVVAAVVFPRRAWCLKRLV